ncbi:MAG: SecE/Sec61-gamma subunit of protein translocation complex [Chloroflexota bacterium]|jgi:preprotein translocase subunit SecE|nr:SecE/Sec61-gamma subunit of protein translocation complex [Chloroflexota bacterium]
MAVENESSNYAEVVRGTGLRATWYELRRVVWPTRQELLRMTGIVVGTVVVISLFIAGIDALLFRVTTFLYGSST